jgi:hypothetical protein
MTNKLLLFYLLLTNFIHSLAIASKYTPVERLLTFIKSVPSDIRPDITGFPDKS